MINIFGKKKKEENKQAKPLVNAVDQAMRQQKEERDTQEGLDHNRKDKTAIEQGFAELVTPEVLQNSRKSAAANEAKLDKLWKAMKLQPADDNSGETKVSKLWDMEKDVFIVPGGYSEMPTEENGVPKNNLDRYNLAIDYLSRGYKAKTTADAVASGADKLDGFVVDFLGNLRNAMETGRAMKADACIDMIRYVLVVGYRYEDTSDPEKFKKRVQTKVEFIENIGKHLIEAVDYYYTLLTKYELEEERYAQVLFEFDRMVEPYNNECPPEVREKLERLGFKRAMKELPAGDEGRKYMGILLGAQSYLTRAIMSSLRLEAFSMEILRERANLQDLVYECKKAFELSGDDFNFEEHSRVIETIQLKSINEINALHEMVAAESERNERMRALMDEAAENEELGKRVGEAQMAIDKFNRLQKRNQKLREDEKVTRIESEKQRAIVEKNERERLKQLQQELEQMQQDVQQEEELVQNEEPMIIEEM